MAICAECLEDAERSAAAKAAAPPEPLDPLAAAVLMGHNASLLEYGRPADATLH
jgi:hypothetical protein